MIEDVILRIVSPVTGSYPTGFRYFDEYEYYCFLIFVIFENNALIYGTGDTGKKKGKSIRQYLCTSSKNQTKSDDSISVGQNEHDLAVIKDNPKV